MNNQTTFCHAVITSDAQMLKGGNFYHPIHTMKIAVTLIMLLLVFTTNAQNTFPSSGNVGIGTTSPAAKLSFNNVDDGSNTASGITWYNPSPLGYGIYRTAGAWTHPDYQQLKLSFSTGIVLDPGTLYGKSYVDVQGAGLRVTSGKVGIGTVSPQAQLEVKGPYAGISHVNINCTSGSGAELRFSQADVIKGFVWYSSPHDVMGFGRGSANNSLFVNANGLVGVGTMTPDSKLTVKGIVHAEEVKVDLSVPGPDYVFEKNYNLTSLTELKSYIEANKHLPEVPSAKEMEQNGIKVGEMEMLLLKKIEELTLHVIKQNEMLQAQQKEIELLKESQKD
jgi:hypothetical protein